MNMVYYVVVVISYYYGCYSDNFPLDTLSTFTNDQLQVFQNKLCEPLCVITSKLCVQYMIISGTNYNITQGIIFKFFIMMYA